jgi:hypothetical protein
MSCRKGGDVYMGGKKIKIVLRPQLHGDRKNKLKMSET